MDTTDLLQTIAIILLALSQVARSLLSRHHHTFLLSHVYRPPWRPGPRQAPAEIRVEVCACGAWRGVGSGYQNFVASGRGLPDDLSDPDPMPPSHNPASSALRDERT